MTAIAIMLAHSGHTTRRRTTGEGGDNGGMGEREEVIHGFGTTGWGRVKERMDGAESTLLTMAWELRVFLFVISSNRYSRSRQEKAFILAGCWLRHTEFILEFSLCVPANNPIFVKTQSKLITRHYLSISYLREFTRSHDWWRFFKNIIRIDIIDTEIPKLAGIFRLNTGRWNQFTTNKGILQVQWFPASDL